jgi:hypothetical protein
MYRVLATVLLARIGNFVDIGNHYVQGTRTLSSWPALRWVQRRFGKSCLQQAQRRRKTFSALISFSRPPRMSESFALFCPQKHCMYTNSTLEYTKSEAASRSGGQKWILWTSTGTLNLMNTQRNTECKLSRVQGLGVRVEDWGLWAWGSGFPFSDVCVCVCVCVKTHTHTFRQMYISESLPLECLDRERFQK